MFKWLRNRRAKPAAPYFAKRKAGEGKPEEGFTSVRRWDAAKTNRLNSMHWAGVTGATINADLNSYLETLRTRAEFEASLNSDAAGVIETHVNDVVGENGPTLQVQSNDETYNEKLEALWRKWWAMPDVNGQLAGVDLLRLWIRLLWTNGEWLNQIMVDEDAEGPIKTRLLPIAPRRLQNPTTTATDPNRFMGVLRNKLGKPLKYWISAPLDTALSQRNPTDGDDVPAEDIDHGFLVLEPGQVRGVPLLATGLQAIGDLRDFDAEVLEAARQAANYGVILHTNHPEANYIEVNESVEIERGCETTAPPGWTPFQMTPQQPSTQYNDYHDEQLRKVGRPACMPLMMIKLDASDHNYSSARFDSKGYERATRNGFRALTTRRSLNRFVDIIAREAGLVPGTLPPKPETVTYAWQWDGFAQADPLKEDKSVTERLANGTATMRDECAARNLHWEDVIQQRGREARALEAEKLPVPGAQFQKAGLYVGPEDKEPEEEKDKKNA